MATAKKSHSVKKKSSTGKAKARPLTWKFYVTTIGIFVVAVTTVVVLGLLAASYVATSQKNERLGKIQSVYSSLAIDEESYRLVNANVFGDKRPYEWDTGRSYSSSKEYVHGDTVQNTFNELDAKIRDAGFTFIDEPYPGAVYKQYHYKSENGEYIRLSVSSKLYDDALFNASVMNEDITQAIDNASSYLEKGPSTVLIKVNLDDNNE